MSIKCMRWAISLSFLIYLSAVFLRIAYGQAEPIEPTVMLNWKHAANPNEYSYLVHYEEVRDFSHCYKTPRLVIEQTVDGRTFDALCNWCELFGDMKVSIKVKPYRISDHAMADTWSNEVIVQEECP